MCLVACSPQPGFPFLELWRRKAMQLIKYLASAERDFQRRLGKTVVRKTREKNPSAPFILSHHRKILKLSFNWTKKDGLFTGNKSTHSIFLFFNLFLAALRSPCSIECTRRRGLFNSSLSMQKRNKWKRIKHIISRVVGGAWCVSHSIARGRNGERVRDVSHTSEIPWVRFAQGVKSLTIAFLLQKTVRVREKVDLFGRATCGQ